MKLIQVDLDQYEILKWLQGTTKRTLRATTRGVLGEGIESFKKVYPNMEAAIKASKAAMQEANNSE